MGDKDNELTLIVDPAETRPRVVTFGPPVLVGGITPRVDLPVDAKQSTGKVGFMVYQVTGTDMYRLPEGCDPDKMDITDAWETAKPANLVTTRDGLRDGDKLIVQDLFGLGVGVIQLNKAGDPLCTSPCGKRIYFIQFVNDRQPPAPPRWVCTGSGNLAAIRKMELTTNGE